MATVAPTSSAAALSQLQKAQSTAQNPNQILTNENQALGVNSAQQTVTGLQGAINSTTKLLQQVAPSVMGRTANSLVTNAQASKQIDNEQAPISANLSTENTNYNSANQNLNTLQGQAQTAATGIYQGQQDKETYLQNLYNTLYGREQDAAKAKTAAAAASEAKREFNVQEAQAAAKTSASSSAAAAKTPSKTEVASQITAGLKKVTGGDGFVSPQDYAKAYDDWTAAGYSGSSFDSYFAKFKNPKNGYYNYAISQSK